MNPKKSLAAMSFVALVLFLFATCSKTTPQAILSDSTGATAFKVDSTDSASFISIVDSSDTIKSFNIYDNCASLVGTITANSSNKIKYSNQTSTSITITGTTAKTLTKGVTYYFRRTSCSSGKYLAVKYATGTQTFCNSFNLNACTWSLNTSCSIVSSYSFVTSLPLPCQ